MTPPAPEYAFYLSNAITIIFSFDAVRTKLGQWTAKSLRIPSGIVSTKDGGRRTKSQFLQNRHSIQHGMGHGRHGSSEPHFRSQLSEATTKIIAFSLMYTRQRNPCIVLMTLLSRVNVSCQVDESTFRQAIKARGKKEEHYRDGLVSFDQRVDFSIFSGPFRGLSSVTLSALAETRIPPSTTLPRPLSSPHRLS